MCAIGNRVTHTRAIKYIVCSSSLCIITNNNNMCWLLGCSLNSSVCVCAFSSPLCHRIPWSLIFRFHLILWLGNCQYECRNRFRLYAFCFGFSLFRLLFFFLFSLLLLLLFFIYFLDSIVIVSVSVFYSFFFSSFGIDFMWHWWCHRRCWQTSQATAVFPYPLIRNNSNSYIALVDWLVGATASQMNKNSEYNKKKYDMIFMLGAGWRMHVRACVCVFFYFLINLNH